MKENKEIKKRKPRAKKEEPKKVSYNGKDLLLIKDKENASIVINKDGSVVNKKTNAKDILIYLEADKSINRTQIKALFDLYRELKSKGACDIRKRDNDVHINLPHAKIKYNIR